MSKTRLHATGNDLPAKAREQAVALLNQALADPFTGVSRELDKALWFLEASA